MQPRPMGLAVAACLLFTTGAVPNGQAPASIAARPALAEPSIAADGSEIAFVSGGDIWTVAAAGGQARLLISHAANDTHPVFSPDKSRVAFVSTRTGNGDIYLLTLATGDVRLLDGSILRLPRSRLTDRNGADMEMHPRPVDVEVKRPIGEGYGGKDSQLDKAVEVLLAQIRS